jgi:hypothetical protein
MGPYGLAGFQLKQENKFFDFSKTFLVIGQSLSKLIFCCSEKIQKTG